MYPGSGTNVLTLFAVDAQLWYSSLDIRQKLIELLADMGSGYHVGVILNTSLGYLCPSGDYLDKTCVESGALAWLEQVRGPDLFPTGNTGPASLENMFLHVTAAGNVMAPGDTDAVMNNEWTAARLLPGLVVPGTTTPLTNLTNTLVIENRERSPVLLGGTPGCRAADSKFPGNLSAIGQNVFSFTGNCEFCYDWADGTSQATPQVAGLAAYMWTIKPGLTPQGIMDILLKTSDSSSCGGTNPSPVIDAYAAVLALDRNYPDMEVRRAILDLNEDRFFDEKDVEKFLTEFDVANGVKDYSRYDLNGDGQTGGTETRLFNLNMDYPPTYTTVTQTIEGNSVNFDENSLTDLDILCYYAYSPLYTGSDSKRRDLLAKKCGAESLTVTYAISYSSYEWYPPSTSCNLNQGEGVKDQYGTPLALPIRQAVSCDSNASSYTTIQKIGPNHLTIDFTAFAHSLYIPDSSNRVSGAATVSQGLIETGTYTIEINPVLTFSQLLTEYVAIAFELFTPLNPEPYMTFDCIERPPYAEDCSAGPRTREITIPENETHGWEFYIVANTGFAAGVPETLEISGRALSVQRK
jgi:hypothetical protein